MPFRRSPALALLAAICLASPGIRPAQAEAPEVRIGAITLKPYVLQQLDQGGTFGQSREGGQVTGFNLRRSRVGVQAEIADQAELGLVYDFGSPVGEAGRLFQADIAYTGLKPFVFRAGVFKPSFTLEFAQGAADILFLERTSIVGLVGGLVAGAGRVGAQAGAGGERWFAAAWLTGGVTGPGAQSDQRAVLGRVAGLAVRTDAVSLHLGLSGAWLYRPPASGGMGRRLSFSEQPELQVDDTAPPLDTGAVAARGARMGGVELGLGWRRLWAQAEAYAIGVQRPGGGEAGPLSGAYLQAAYVLLGEPRRWKASTASWGSPGVTRLFDPAGGGWGALEVGGRFSVASLDAGGLRGGRQTVGTVGLSWYPAEPLRVMLQYQHAEIRGGAAPRRFSAVALRGQLHF